MFGFEESYGCLSGTHARDKDAVVASMLFAELACFEENEGSSVYDRLQRFIRNTDISLKGHSRSASPASTPWTK